jgi:hypothetical protein
MFVREMDRIALNVEVDSKYRIGYLYIHIYIVCGSNSSVGIATGYGLDGPEIESRWGRDFSNTSRQALVPTQPPVQWVSGLSRG